MGSQVAADSTVSWSTAKPFVIGQDYKADFQVDGRFLAVKFESDSDISWQLHGYAIEYEDRGDG